MAQTAPTLQLVAEDVPGAVKVATYLTETYGYTRDESTEPSDFEMTVLSMAKDIMDAIDALDEVRS